MPQPVSAKTSRRLLTSTAAVFVVGILLNLLLWSRSQVAGDQLNMLARGWLLVVDGRWIPYGLITSAGGKAPGGLTALVVGLPLSIWRFHRAPTLLLMLFHLGAYLLLDRIARRELGPWGRLLLAIVYWLNPWRLYHSGFLWNSSFLLPLGGLHFWTLYQQRERASFWPSFWQVLAIGLAAQLHPSSATLVVLSLLLWARGYFRFHWPAVFLATSLVLLSLVPWVLAILQHPEILPSVSSQHGRLSQSALSTARGLGYWLRYPALIASSTILCLDFGRWSSELGADRLRQVVQIGVGLVTLPLVVWANLRLWRDRRGWWRRPVSNEDFVGWLIGVLRWSFLGILLVCALTPTAIMSWQLLNVLHLAVMPLVLLAMAELERGRLGATIATAGVYAALCVVLTFAIGWASPMYRCGGDTCGAMNATPPPLRSHHPMLNELGIQATCAYELDVPGGWWPDVLPEAPRGDD